MELMVKLKVVSQIKATKVINEIQALEGIKSIQHMPLDDDPVDAGYWTYLVVADDNKGIGLMTHIRYIKNVSSCQAPARILSKKTVS